MNTSEKLTILHGCVSDQAILSGGNWNGTLDNLKLAGRYYHGARSASPDPSDTTFDINLGGTDNVRGIVLGPGNFTTAATATLTRFGDAGYTVPVETWTLDALKPRVPWGAIPFGAKFWFSGITPWPNPERRTNLIFSIDRDIGGQFWRVEIDDRLNPDGFIEFGRLFVAGAWIPEFNYQPEDNAFGIRDNSLKSSTLSGSTLVRRRINPRFFSFSINYLDQDAVFGEFFDMLDVAGFDQEVFVIPEAADQGHIQQRSFFARISQANQIAQALCRRGHIALELTEII